MSLRSRMHVLACVASLIALAQAGASSAALAASPPVVKTGPAQFAQTDTATVTGTVDPNGSSTYYYFEYGTTAAYGTQTSAVQAGAGDADVFADATLSGLEADTTYHYRLVAVGDATTVVGADATFATRAASPPSVSTGAATDLTTDSAVLAGTVDPAGTATSYYFEYGAGALTARTPSAFAGAGTKSVAVSAALTGLASYTLYEYRLVAVGARTVFGAIRTFKTGESPPRLSLTSLANPVGAGYGVTFTGTLTGSDVGVREVALEIEPYPYTAGFQQYGAAEPTSAGGAFSFTLPDVTIDTRVRAVTVGGTPSLTSATVLEQALVRISVNVRWRHHAAHFTGLIAPASAPVTIEIQRRAGSRWRTIARALPHPIAGDLGAFSRTIGRPRPGYYRVLAIVSDGSLLPGRSRVLKLG